ncbi:MAG: ABC transporter ATP-binding protein [Elusimicrobia bacterium]|nr:ABC transporter ATP-binding protein [Elusimicrobiota bacterium]
MKNGKALMDKILSVEGLRKEFGAVSAVDGVSFDVGPGEIVGLLGPNGAGKTTTITMILGVLEPTVGQVRIEGRERMNFAAVYTPLPGNLTVTENLRVFGLIYGVDDLSARIEALVREFDLGRYADTKAGHLSSGEQTRLCLAKAMLNSPRLLLLDEPTASLDPSVAREIRAKIKAFVAGGTSGVLWTSHNMHEVEEVCDRVLFLSHGKILLQGDPRTLPGQHGHKTLEDLFVAVAREPLSYEG